MAFCSNVLYQRSIVAFCSSVLFVSKMPETSRTGTPPQAPSSDGVSGSEESTACTYILHAQNQVNGRFLLQLYVAERPAGGGVRLLFHTN
jgi:hypothetical protein